MKKMIPVMMLSGIIGLSACGNKTEQPQQNADTLEVADTIKEDTLPSIRHKRLRCRRMLKRRRR